MSTRVVSTKLNQTEYDKLVEACNTEGLSISVMVKDAILMRVDPNYFTDKMISKMNSDSTFLSQVSGIVKEKTCNAVEKERSSEDRFKDLNIDKLKKELGIRS